jgi:flagellar motor switch protein FliG
MFSLVQKRLEARDPFQRIRKTPVPALAEALKGESSQVMAIVLSELSPSGSSQLISKLDETIRPEVLRCMTSSREVSIEAKQRVAGMIERNLAAQTASQEEGGSVPDKKLRKVAVLLRGMEVDAREPLLKGLEEQDADKHKAILELMILWEDISIVSDRSLQEALRSVSSASLALSLIGADASVAEKIQGNISERAKAAIEEEASLLSSPSPSEVEQARQEILQTLRDMSIRGELQFIQE